MSANSRYACDKLKEALAVNWIGVTISDAKRKTT